MSAETTLDRIARALGNIPVREVDGIPVYLDLAVRIQMAAAALSVIPAETRGGQPGPVLPARFITDAMAHVPDALPPNFAGGAA